MQSLDDEERKMVLGEVLADELKAIHEYVSVIPALKRNMDNLQTDVGVLKDDMRVVKAVVTDHSRLLKTQSDQLKGIDNRLTYLEAARA